MVLQLAKKDISTESNKKTIKSAISEAYTVERAFFSVEKPDFRTSLANRRFFCLLRLTALLYLEDNLVFSTYSSGCENFYSEQFVSVFRKIHYGTETFEVSDPNFQ